MEEMIVCDVCKKEMNEGYVVADGLENYCSEKCLHSIYTKEEYEKMYEEDYAYWTMFEE